MAGKAFTPTVFFNASVILAGLFSRSGGSAKLLKWVRQKKITGIISEIVLDEVIRKAPKIRLSAGEAQRLTITTFSQVLPAPEDRKVTAQKRFVFDQDDAHILASAKQARANFLVTLDKKHLLILQNKIKWTKIVSPKQLIETLSAKK